MSPAEQVLLRRWTDQRDAEAFAEIVKRYAGLVYGTCRRVLRNEKEAEDVAQECFLKLAQTRRAAVDSLGGWLHTVATREALNRLKTEQRRAARERAYAEAQHQHTEIQWDDLQQWVDEAIEALPEDLREPLVHHFIQGETQDEIARRLEVSRSTITRRIGRGIEEIRIILQKRGVAIPAVALSASLTEHMAEAAPGSLRAAMGRFALSGAEQVHTPKPSLPARWPVTLSVATGLIAVTVVLLVAWGGYPGRAPEPASEAPAVKAGAAVTAAVQPVAPLSNAEVAQAIALEPLTPDAPAAVDASRVEPVPVPDTETVSLRCVDPIGQAVPGAKIYFIHIESFSDAMTYPAKPSERLVKTVGPVVADGEGWVHIAEVPQFSTRFGGRGAYAQVPGQWAGIWHERSLKGPGTEPTSDIVMAPAIDVTGRVELAAGAGDVTSVTVEVLTLMRREVGGMPASFSLDYTSDRPQWPEVFRAAPDENGSFVIADMPQDATVYLSANGPGLGNSQFMGSVLTGQTVTLIMEPEGVVEGTVVREGADEPVSGMPVVVQAEQARGILLPHMVTTDAQGRYRVAGLASGEYSVRIAVGNQPSEFNARPLMVNVMSGESVAAPPLVLERGTLVSGSVRDAQTGTPVVGATLVALHPPETGGTAVASARAADDGGYVMRLPVGEYMLYFFDVTERYVYPAKQGKRTVIVPPMQQIVSGIDFQLTRSEALPAAPETATIRGTVVDEEGEPLEGAWVWDNQKYMDGEDERQISSPLGRSGVDGTFEYKVLARGEHQLRVGGEKFTIEEGEAFTPVPDGTYDAVLFRLSHVYGTFSGVVVDEDGNPVPSAIIDASSREPRWTCRDVTTDADGWFHIDPAPENTTIHFFVRKPGSGYKDYSAPSDEVGEYVLPREEE